MLLTNTAHSYFHLCERKYYWRYRRGLVAAAPSFFLEVGSAFHSGLAALLQGATITQAIGSISLVTQSKEVFECRQIARFLVERYHEYWTQKGDNDWEEVIAIEQPHQMRLDRGIHLAGVPDVIVRDKRGGLWVVEHKTTSSIDVDYLEKVVLDPQITTYLILARDIVGEVPEGVIYNVIGRPRIYRRNDEKIEDYLKRAKVDYLAAPGSFIGRQRAFRSEQSLDSHVNELKRTAREVWGCARSGTWMANGHVCFVRGRRCPYVELCSRGEIPQAMALYRSEDPFCELKP